MMNITELSAQLDALARVSSTLDPNEEERQALLEQTVAYSHEFLNTLAQVPAYEDKDPNDLSIGAEPRSFKDLLQIYQKEVVETGIKASSGKYMGYIPGGGLFSAALADFIAAFTNPYASVYYASPGAAMIENEVLNWMKNVFHYPQSAVGSLNSGGSISNLIAFTAARDKHGIKNELVSQSVVYLSQQVHHSAQKALRIIGLGDVILRYLPLDEHHKIKTDVLEQLVQEDKASGLNPFMIIGTAGTTDTGAVDPLDKMADIAEQHQLWFHVDGAYGGFFILTSKKDLFKGIERSDSLIVDPHKGMFLPYGVGAVLIKDKAATLQSNYYSANYMQDAAAEELIQSPSNLSPELTKHFRGLRVWLPLQLHGVSPFIACLEEKLLLAQYFRARLLELGFELGPEPDLSVSYFRYPFKENADELNKQLMDLIHQDGDVFLSSSVINNQYVIRMAILVFRTKRETIDSAVAMIQRCLKQIQE